MNATLRPAHQPLASRLQAKPVSVRALSSNVKVRNSTGPEVESTQNVCSMCGADLAQRPSGCDGQGRVVGGLGAVPGFGWWPIKAYRPCPRLAEAGVEYVRKGQLTNEMLFGGVSLGDAKATQSLDEIKKAKERGLDIKI